MINLIVQARRTILLVRLSSTACNVLALGTLACRRTHDQFSKVKSAYVGRVGQVRTRYACWLSLDGSWYDTHTRYPRNRKQDTKVTRDRPTKLEYSRAYSLMFNSQIQVSRDKTFSALRFFTANVYNSTPKTPDRRTYVCGYHWLGTPGLHSQCLEFDTQDTFTANV